MKKIQKKKVTKPVNKTLPKSDGKFYTANKDNDSGLWEVKLAKVKGATGKVIAKFKTKPEAEDFMNDLTTKNGRKAIIHNSKGANKGKTTKVK